MPIAVTCPNGHALNLDSKYSGKRVRCTKCEATFLVDGEAVTANSPPRKSSDTSAARRRDDDDDDDRPRKRRRDEDDEDERDDDDDRPRKHRRDEEDEDDDDRPRKRRRDEEDEDDDDDRPRKRRGRDDDDDDDDDDDRGGKSGRKAKADRQQMRGVASGLNLLGWKYLLLACYFGINLLVMMAGLLVALVPRAGGAIGVLIMILGIVGLLVYLAVIVLGIIGGVMLLKIPQKSGARGLAMANLILEITYVVLGIMVIIFAFSAIAMLFGMGAAGRGPGGAEVGMGMLIIVLAILWLLVVVAGFVIFMVLLRLTAFFVKAKKLAGTAIVLMIVTIATPLAVAGLGSVLGMALSRSIAGVLIQAALNIAVLGVLALIMIRIRGVCVALAEKAAD